jgi:hypothetical protein
LILAPDAYSEVKQVSLTTYYPSPYGEYTSLNSKTLKIGGGNTSVPQDGVINFKPQNSLADASGYEGDLYYDNNLHYFRYKNNNAVGWQNLRGPNIVTAVTSTFSTNLTTWVNVVSMTQNFPGGMASILFNIKPEMTTPATALLVRGYFQLLVDGIMQDQAYAQIAKNVYQSNPTLALTWAGNLSSGSHTVTVQCKTDSNDSSVTAYGTPRLTVTYL